MVKIMKLLTLMPIPWLELFPSSVLSERLILLTDVKGVLDKNGNYNPNKIK